MKSKIVALEVAVLILSALMITNFLAAIPVQAISTTKLHNADAMWVEPFSNTFVNGMPNATVGQTFNVTVWLNMTEKVFNYQIGLYYNCTQLMCTRGGFTGVTRSNFMTGHSTNAIGPQIDTSYLGNGSVLATETCLGSDFVAGPHNGSLIWMEFQILIAPATGNLLSTFDLSTTTTNGDTWASPDGGAITYNVAPSDGAYLFKLTQYTSFTIITSNSNETHTFEITVIMPDLTMISTQQATANITSQINFTEEQRTFILNSSSVRVITSSGSYLETSWINLWFLPIGIYWHMFLTGADAQNLGTALDEIFKMCGVCAALLACLVPLGGILVGVAGIVADLISIDYETMYLKERKSDKSFDIWGEISIFNLYSPDTLLMETRRYCWSVTLLGAYITRDKTIPYVPEYDLSWWMHAGGGSRARAI